MFLAGVLTVTVDSGAPVPPWQAPEARVAHSYFAVLARGQGIHGIRLWGSPQTNRWLATQWVDQDTIKA